MDGRRQRGQRTRASILDAAADLASVDGLEGLTIGRLATELEMSKSGLFAHFGSKEELQLATNEAARQRFLVHVVEPTAGLPPGRERLDALLGRWLAYMRERVFAGGCYFTAVRVEYDSRPDGPVRDAVAGDQRRWLRRLAGEVRRARPELAEEDAEQLAYELDALGMGANLQFQLFRDPVVFDRAARAFAARLDAPAP